ncbi:hypothetical protein FHU38_004178 [Saccharomonospora amisosensis]|uniref:Uncharacterized protein n=1 Tax=Saccharomonospora amisosensis TaxID=1128677 RepID=A0A7X5UT98_9PSEU|nr:hypothetical protein [Saccharomonospora amisosensis]NIJ13834.1 hypothetical protein [Saccharomonospora amisosensis]
MTEALEALEVQAEIDKLARVLGEPGERFGFLESVPARDIRRLRERATDALFDADLAALRRMALASRLLPPSLLAGLAERVFGPLLSARMAGLVDASRALDIAARLSPTFLADVAAETDPRRIGHLVTGVPRATISVVVGELHRRQDWITLGRFVTHVPNDTALAGLSVLDDAALLRVMFLLDDTDRAVEVLGLLPTRRRERIVRAADEHDLWPPLFALAYRADARLRDELVHAIGALDQQARARAVRQARELGVAALLEPSSGELAG